MRWGRKQARRNQRDEYYLYAGVREFLVVFFLLVPTMFWALVLWGGSRVDTVWISLLFASFAAGTDFAIREYDKFRH